MSFVLKAVARVGLVVCAVSTLSVVGAEARPARPVPQATTSMTEPARAADSMSTLAPDERGVPMCEESRMQVPAAGGGLTWEHVEDCDQD
jgi:hypothetical protein